MDPTIASGKSGASWRSVRAKRAYVIQNHNALRSYDVKRKSLQRYKSVSYTHLHLEISGGAFGAMALLGRDPGKGADTERTLFERPKGQERTFHQLAQPITGQKIRFTNVEQETPIGELSAYYVHPGKEPSGIAQLKYRLTGRVEADNPSVAPLAEFIAGRYPPEERMTMVALPAGAPRTTRKGTQSGMPLVHILVPCDFREIPNSRYSYTWDNMSAGLDLSLIHI